MIRDVTAAVVMNEGKILIAQKGPQDKRAYRWEFPGGKIDAGETPEECVVRELLEEFEIEIRVGELLCESLFTYEEGQLLVKAYCCTWVSGELNPTEHADFRWVDPDELSQFDFVASDIPVAEKVLQQFGKATNQ